MPSTRLVVARYTEPLDWLPDIRCSVTVYNKDSDMPSGVERVVIPLPNLGRESHTYLHHIVHNYNCLDDHTVFAQGRPFDHCRFFVNQVNQFAAAPQPGFHDFADRVLDDYSTCAACKHHSWIPMAQTYEALFGQPAPDTAVCFGAGAQFAVSRDLIRAHPVEFYERALAISSLDTPEHPTHAAHAFERLWRVIFE